MTTPWSTQLQSLVIVTAPAGAYAGIFIYSPAPGLGNLIGSWAAQAGVDPFGNAYPQGLNVTIGTITGVTFTGTHFILNSSGFFFYSGVPALGNLATSIAPTAGTDTFGNVYPAGVGIEQNGLVLFNQGSAPASNANGGVIYMGSTGRLRYINNFGVDLVLDRCGLNLSNFTMNTQTLPVQMSGPLLYQAGEAVVGSEFEVQIDGTVTTPNTTTALYTYDLFLDGTTWGTGFATTIGSVVVQTGFTYAVTLRCKATVNATGVSGNVNLVMEGAWTRKGVNIGNAQQFTTINNVVVNVPFNSTIAHTLAIFANWSSTTGTGHSAITYQTKVTRRN